MLVVCLMVQTTNMSHFFKQKYELALTLHLTGIPTSCHPFLRKLPTCHTQLHGKTTDPSQSMKQEYLRTATLH
jgi:hypothetical protein